MASPFLNILSYWFFFFGSSHVVFIVLSTGPFSGGWTAYPPLSGLPQASDGSGTGMTMVGQFDIFVVSVLLGGINYITRFLNLRQRDDYVEITNDCLGVFCNCDP